MLMWIERWQQLAKNLKRQGAFVQPIDIQPVATEQELQQVEAQLGIQIPSEFRQVLQKCSQQVDVYWTLPDEVIIPSELTDIPSGDFGWSLANLYVPDEQLYLQFHSARNGDAVLIKLEDATIWCWSHEEDQYDYLATNFQSYVDAITTLGCIGIDCGQHRQFCDTTGLNLQLTSSQIWLDWLEQYSISDLQQAKLSLHSLLLYASMHGIKETEVQQAFLQFDKEQIYQVLRQNIEQEQSTTNQKAWSDILVNVCASEAVKWVRALWQKDSNIASGLRDYLTAQCLPSEEGLSLILNDIEKDKVNGYTALQRLRHFQHPSIIEWMQNTVAFPIDGWDILLAQSQPSAERLLEWLNGREVERLIAIHAIHCMMRGEIVPTSVVKTEKWRPLLAFWEKHEVLQKNKKLFSQALNGLDNWLLKQQRGN